jgi:Fur family transcriptional regulator, ferric uptake regulator
MDSIINQLATMKARMTTSRKKIIEILENGEKPISAQDVLQQLRERRCIINKTTVYRELAFLEHHGLIASIQFHERQKRYELSNRPHHHHAICTMCGSVNDIRLSRELHNEERIINRKYGFSTTKHALEFFGVCEKCK